MVKEDYQIQLHIFLSHGHKGLNSMKVFDKYVFAISKILPSLDFKSLGLGDVARWLDTGMLAVHVYKSTGHFLSLKCSRIWKEIWVTYRMQRISGMVKSINSLHKTFCLLASRLLPVFSEFKKADQFRIIMFIIAKPICCKQNVLKNEWIDMAINSWS